jgi:hypothetical protein
MKNYDGKNKVIFMAVWALLMVFPIWADAATQNSSNQQYTNNSDGFVLAGGTTTRSLTVTGGNITLTGSSSGNVGIGSSAPGQLLDVQGTVRAIGLIAGAGGITLGGVNNTSWPSGGSSNWIYSSSGNVGLSTTAAVGIGTTFVGGTGEGALSVMNGNVGIGTWLATNSLTVNGWERIYSPGNDTALLLGTGSSGAGPGGYLIGLCSTCGGDSFAQHERSGGMDVVGFNGIVFSGDGWDFTMVMDSNLNVGIGTWNPISKLQVTGTVNATAFVGDGSGLTNLGGLSNWIYSSAGNIGLSTTAAVGIGTTFVGGSGEAALSIMNGNVGVGTWVPNSLFQVLNGVEDFRFSLGAASLTPTIAAINNSGKAVALLAGTNGATFNYDQTGAFGIQYDTHSNFTSNNLGTGTIPFEIVGAPPANSFYMTASGNIGIGTSTPVGGLTIMNGNVGIGTWVPAANMQVENKNFITNEMLVNDGVTGAPPAFPNSLLPAFTVQTGLTNGSRPLWFGYNNSGAWASFLTIGACGSFDAICLDMGDVGNIYTALRSSGPSLLIGGFAGSSGMVDGTFTDVAFGNSGNVGIGTTGTYPGASSKFLIAQTDGSTGIVIGNGTGTGRFAVNGNSDGSWTAFDYGAGSWTAGITQKSGNVGIGTSVPKGTLDVGSAGTICLGGTCNSNWPAGGSSNWTYSSSGNVGLSTIASVGIGTTFVGGAGEAALSVMKGNVGIGTWVPSQSLNTLGNILLGNGTGTSPHLYFYSTNYSIASGASQLVFTPGGAAAVTMNSDGGIILPGNVGIGTATTTAGAALSVMNGNVGIGTWVPAHPLDITSATDGLINIAGTVPTAYTQMFYRGTGRQYQTGVGNASETAYGVSNKYYLYDSNAAAMRIVVDANGNVGIGTPIPMGGLSVMNGNVGIGTWVPQTPLQILGGTTNTSGLQILNSAQVADNIWADSSGLFRFDSGNGSNHSIILNGVGGGGVGIGTTLATTAGLTVMNGNVGIGTWIPSQTFQVGNESSYTKIDNTGHLTGNAQMILSSQITAANFITANGSTSAIGLSLNAPSGVAVDLLKVVTNSGPTQVGIDKNGNVGIGTDILNQKLGVVGNIGIGTVGYDSYLTTAPPSGGMIIEGNVGIGSLTPGQALDVKGTARMTGFNLTGNGAANGSIMVSNAVGVGTWMPSSTLPAATLNTGTVNQVAYYSGTSTLSGSSMVFNSPNVGVGSTNPGVKLDVNGSVRSLSGGYYFPDGSIQTTAYRGIPQNIQVFTASGTWTQPAGVSTVYVRCWGAGGSGSNGSSSVGGAGGGGGGYCEGLIGVNGNVTVGIGTGSAGNNGGNTTFAAVSTLTADGGTKATTTTGGGGGAASNGTINLTGATGGSSVSVSGAGGGAGGGSPLGGAGGGGGPGGNTASPAASGAAGTTPGGGGGGGSATTGGGTGAKGGDGLCIVEY